MYYISGTGICYEESARFASKERRLRRRMRGGDLEFRAQLALRAKSGAVGAPSYRTGTGIGNQKVKFVYFGYQKSTNILAGTVSLTL